jgi:hypothetical protein
VAQPNKQEPSANSLWHPLIGQASFHLGKRNAEAVNSSSQTVGVFEGSVVVGGLEGASVGGVGVGVGGGSSAGGAVGLGAGRGAFFRFTVFLLTSSLSSSSSRATFSPTYGLSRIADKALIFDGSVAQHKLRSRLAWGSSAT